MGNKMLWVLFLCVGVSACVKDQDFDQWDQVALHPTLESGILYLETPESVLNQAGEAVFLDENISFGGFSAEVFATRVREGELFYEVENTTSKPVEITVTYLDAAGNVLDSVFLEVDPAPSGGVERKVRYGGASGKSIEIIKNIASVRVSLQNMGDQISESTLPDPKIVFRSSGKFKMRIG